MLAQHYVFVLLILRIFRHWQWGETRCLDVRHISGSSQWGSWRAFLTFSVRRRWHVHHGNMLASSPTHHHIRTGRCGCVCSLVPARCREKQGSRKCHLMGVSGSELPQLLISHECPPCERRLSKITKTLAIHRFSLCMNPFDSTFDVCSLRRK